jgi:hypothetical protein
MSIEIKIKPDTVKLLIVKEEVFIQKLKDFEESYALFIKHARKINTKAKELIQLTKPLCNERSDYSEGDSWDCPCELNKICELIGIAAEGIDCLVK